MIDTEKLCQDFDLLAYAQQLSPLKKSGNYWTGPCPICGGRDRFLIKQHEGQTKFYCRNCGDERYHDAIEFIRRYYQVDFLEACKWMASGGMGRYEIDPARLAETERTRQEREARDADERTRRLAEFSDRWIAEEHHTRLTRLNFDWWESQGIPQAWVEWWKLGYTAEKKFKHADEVFARPAYIIPKYDFRWTPRNVDYRIVDPPEGVGKYRMEYGLPAVPFFTRPDLSAFPGEVYVTEGSKKAMVTALHIDPDADMPMVIGVPSKNSWCGLPDRLQNVDRAWIILDPGAELEAKKLATMIGSAARVISLPFKIDDGFNYHGLTWRDLQTSMRWAI